MSELVAIGAKCPNCAHDNRAGRKFCSECGTRLAIACPVCGTPNEPGERFCGECGAALDASDGVPERATIAIPRAVERRLVSVLFADLVGHTGLSEQRDVEEVRELLSRYFDVARTIVERYGGEVEKFIGDAVMAVWGAPTAREDDAERAVRAALDLVPAVAELGGEVGAPGLAVRAAVLTGEAAVTIGARGQGMVAGDLVNTASRVQSLAEPGTVLVGEATRRATEASIAYADADRHELKGKAEPVPLWHALRVTAGRGGTLAAEVLEPPFVGRARELRLLKELFHASADERKAQLVSVVGIAGIGKSRLARELEKHFDGVAQSVLWHGGRCLAYGEGVSYWAFAEMVRMRAGIAEGEEPGAARGKLRAMLELHVDDADERDWIEPRLAQLLALEESEAGDRADLFAGWRLFLERLADRSPVVLAFEDMQWADAPLLEFLEYLLDWSRNHPLFVLALSRPELAERHPHWGTAIRNSTTLSLEPLARGAMEELLDGFVPGLPDGVREQVLDRAEGVPLYAVETVRMLLDRGLLEQHGDQYRPTGDIVALEIPETLHALVAARLDDLSEDERRLVQDASVVGKTFGRDPLVAVTSLPEDRIDALLSSLVRKEIVSLQVDPRSPERGQYTFLQDLLRQVAYETMPRGERRARHVAVAAHLDEEGRGLEQEASEIVASHYVTALELDRSADDAATIATKARVTLVKAGERAVALAANESAQRYFEQALELADSPLERAELHERAGSMAALGLRTEVARSHFKSAIAGFDELGLPSPAARVTARLGILTWQHEHDIVAAIDQMERAFAVLVEGERNADLAMLAAQLARPLHFSGRTEDAMATNELALEIGEALLLPDVIAQGLITKGLVLMSRGRHQEAEVLLRHSLALALSTDGFEAALRAYHNLLFVVVVVNDRAREGLELAQAGMAIAARTGDGGSLVWFRSWTSGILGILGEWDEALSMEEQLADHAAPLSHLAGIYLHRGERAKVEQFLSAIASVFDPNETQQRTEVLTFRADVLLRDGKPDEALAAAEEAWAARTEVGVQGVRWALGLALEAAFEIGDVAKMDELLGDLERLPPGEATRYLRAQGARFSGRRAALQGDDATAAAGFLASVRAFQEIEMPFELATVQLEHAEWLAASGRSDEAEPLLAEAREIFQRLGAKPWLERTALVPAIVDEPAPTD